MGRGRNLDISCTWLCSTGLGSNEGDEECYEIISAPALWHKLGLNLPPDRSLMFCAVRFPYLRKKHLSIHRLKPKHVEIYRGQRDHLKRAGLSPSTGSVLINHSGPYSLTASHSTGGSYLDPPTSSSENGLKGIC